jgi:hypothetical protein
LIDDPQGDSKALGGQQGIAERLDQSNGRQLGIARQDQHAGLVRLGVTPSRYDRR